MPSESSFCPEHPKHAHFFEEDGFCVHCLLWSPEEVFQKRQPEKEEADDL